MKATPDEVRAELQEKGLYERDINNVILSARGMLRETYQPKVEEYLLKNKQIHGSEEFNLLDSKVIEDLITRGKASLALKEKKKVTALIKSEKTAKQVVEQVDTRFLSTAEAHEQIYRLQQVKKQNSGDGRMLNIFGGIGLICLTGVLLIAFGRLFYVLPIIGLVMIVKGVTTERMQYED